jgi:hypothetical protein
MPSTVQRGRPDLSKITAYRLLGGRLLPKGKAVHSRGRHTHILKCVHQTLDETLVTQVH